MARQKKRPEEKRPIELTTDEAMERLFSKDVRDRLKEVAQKADKNKGKSLHE